MNTTQIKYRPEIDGLRCIAVLSVIFYHSEILLFDKSFFKGGFLGVDIFFVISGYLITSILLKESEKNNFSLTKFYERRFRRIFPALIFILSTNLIIGTKFLLPDQLIELSESYISSIFFISNYFFYFIDQEYTATSSFLVPFLHTWSLGVEEQFYIFYPLIFILFSNKINFRLIILLLLFSSLLFANFYEKINPSLNFYIIFSRIWELMFGAIIAIYNFNFLKQKNSVLNFLSLIGLVLIFFSMIFASSKIPHPSLFTLIPVIGVSLIILNSNNDSYVNKFLSNNVMVFFGKISFSLYLWHYPIFAYAKIINLFNISLFINILIYSCVFFLSVGTYIFIEQPFRKIKKINFKKLFISSILILFIFLTFSIYAIKEKGLPERYPDVILKHFQNSHPYNLVKKNGKFCHNNICTFNEKSKFEIFLLGDSNIATLQKPILDYTLKEKFKFTTLTSDGCPYIKNFEKKSKKTNQIVGCYNKDFELKRDLILSNRNSLVIIGQRMPLYLSGSYFDNKEGGVEGGKWPNIFVNKENLNNHNDTDIKNFKLNFISSINEILNNGNKIALIYPIPEVGWNPIRRLLNNSYFNKQNIKQMLDKNFISTSYKIYKERTRETYELYDKISHPNVIRIYPSSLFCNTLLPNRCVANDTYGMFYYDDDHLSEYGSTLLFKEILENINF